MLAVKRVQLRVFAPVILDVEDPAISARMLVSHID
jgi:hypothetical protein